MLDFATKDTSLEAKRRELVDMIAEGRQVVAALSERQTALGQRIEEALDGIRRLQDQINAIDVVMGIVDPHAIAFAPPRAPAPVLEVVPTYVERESESAPSRAQAFKPLAYLKCVADGHDFRNSRAMPGYITCRRCKMRRRGS